MLILETIRSNKHLKSEKTCACCDDKWMHGGSQTNEDTHFTSLYLESAFFSFQFRFTQLNAVTNSQKILSN